MPKPIDQLRVDGEKLDARVEANLTPASELLLSLDGASTFSLVVDDPNRDLLESGVLARRRKARNIPRGLELSPWQLLGRVQLSFEGTFWRLAGASISGPLTTLTFEQEIVARLRAHTRFIRFTRRYITNGRIRGVSDRHQVIVHAIMAVKNPSIHYRVFEGSRKVADTEPERDKPVGNHGIPDGSRVKMKGVRVDSEQISELNTALGVADGLHASRRARLAMVCAGIGESTFRPIANLQGSPYGGVFQGKVRGDHNGPAVFTLDQTDRQAHYFLKGGLGFQGGGAMHLASANPSMDPGEIATTVEGSGKPGSFYGRYRTEADAILEAYGSGAADAPKTVRSRYSFTIGTPKNPDPGEREDYFESCLRLAREVETYFFGTTRAPDLSPAGDMFVYGTGAQLLSGQPVYRLAERRLPGDPSRTYNVGLFDSGEWHYNKPAAGLSFNAQLPDRWFAAPGRVAEVVRMGPFTGRWLTQEIRQPLDASFADISLIRPSPPKQEPAGEKTTTRASVPERSGGGGATVKGAIKGSPIPGQPPHAATHQTSGLPGYPAFDYMAPAGTRVVAPVSGEISRLSGRNPKLGGSPGGPLGYSIYLSGSNGKSYFLTHLDHVQVKVNQNVSQGQQIAEVAYGPPSWSSPHCHMGVHG